LLWSAVSRAREKARPPGISPITWTAAGGDPASGDADVFATRFLTPGTFELSVVVERDFTVKVRRPVATGEAPPNAFTMEETTVSGTISGSATLSGTVEDITPPELTFTLAVEGGTTGTVAVTEDPLDAPSPKSATVEVRGPVFSESGEDDVEATATVPVGSTIVVDENLGAGIVGFTLLEDLRFTMQATTTDNASAPEAIAVRWTCREENAEEPVIPEGQVERFVFRASNLAADRVMNIVVEATDEAGNATVVRIPVRVLQRKIRIRALGGFSSQRG